MNSHIRIQLINFYMFIQKLADGQMSKPLTMLKIKNKQAGFLIFSTTKITVNTYVCHCETKKWAYHDLSMNPGGSPTLFFNKCR